MILNYMQRSTARPATVIDNATGRPIELPIFFADDQSGVYLHYVERWRDGKATAYEANPDGSPVIRVGRGDIRIVADEPSPVGA